MPETAICVNKRNGHIYRHIKGDEYINLTTGVQGEIKPELATESLSINLALTQMMNENPYIDLFVEKLNLYKPV
jgi:hypothetical protein